MADRISMVRYDKLIKAHEGYDVDTSAATTLFEAGMIEVVRDVAVSKLLGYEIEKRPDFSEDYNKLVGEQAEIINKIQDNLSPEHEQLANDLDNITGLINSYEFDETFIAGFIEGYKFLRTTYSSYGRNNFSVR
jgi:hypothetical protein